MEQAKQLTSMPDDNECLSLHPSTGLCFVRTQDDVRMVQVRDLLTSTSEQAAKGKSKGNNPTLKADAVPVDAVVSTIGFPLVGGPAGTMEGGRQADVAKGILTAKNIPYIIAAPLLIQVSAFCLYAQCINTRCS